MIDLDELSRLARELKALNDKVDPDPYVGYHETIELKPEDVLDLIEELTSLRVREALRERLGEAK